MKNVFDRSDYRGWNIFRWLKLFVFDLKCCRERITKGYCQKDLWNIDYWFLVVMSDMLSEFNQTTCSTPGRLMEKFPGESGHKEWEAILSKMSFLLNEANEYTCKRINPYAEEHDKAFCEFEEKYGIAGEKLLTDEERSDKHTRRIHFMSEIPEYAYIDEPYKTAEKESWNYRNQCKDEALSLFSEWFWSLWD